MNEKISGICFCMSSCFAVSTSTLMVGNGNIFVAFIYLIVASITMVAGIIEISKSVSKKAPIEGEKQ